MSKEYYVKVARAKDPIQIVPNTLQVEDPKKILLLACAWINYIEIRIDGTRSVPRLVEIDGSHGRKLWESTTNIEARPTKLVDVYKDAKRQAISFANFGSVTQKETDAAVELAAKIWPRGRKLKSAYMKDPSKMKLLRYSF